MHGIVVALLLLVTGVPPLHGSVDGYPEARVALAGDGLATPVSVRVAHTPQQREHGLMEVPALPPGAGMLFAFPEDTRSGFWMKGTLVPLGIAWADADGDVVATAVMEPCRTDPCPVHRPGRSYRYAIEVPAGWFEQLGVRPGWRLAVPGDLPPAE